MRLLAAAVLALVSASCSAPPNRTAPPKTAAKPPTDEAARFPQAGLVKMQLIPDHLLGKNFMPGGNLATYRIGKQEYQQFLGKKSSAQEAAFLLLDWRKALVSPEYLASMGGYFGTDDRRLVYVFTKGPWVAGISGLPLDKADALEREFAARL